LFGGDNPASYLDTIEVFDTVTESFTPGAYYLPSGEALVLTAQDKNMFKLFESDSVLVKIGVEGVYVGNESNCINIGVDAYLYNGSVWAKIT
jgi:hypothetical protein